MIVKTPTDPRDQPPATPHDGVDRRYYFIFNSRSGTALSLGLTSDTLLFELEPAGHHVVVDDNTDATFESRTKRACASDCQVIVAA